MNAQSNLTSDISGKSDRMDPEFTGADPVNAT